MFKEDARQVVQNAGLVVFKGSLNGNDIVVLPELLARVRVLGGLSCHRGKRTLQRARSYSQTSSQHHLNQYQNKILAQGFWGFGG